MVRLGDVPFDLVIKGGSVLSTDGEAAQSDVGVRGQRIETIASPSDHIEGRETLDASGMIVMPGLVNLHDHLRDMTLGLGAGEGLKLDDILRYYWGLSEVAGPAEYATMAAFSTARLLRAGVTSVVDHVYPFHKEGLAAATIEGYESTGIRWYLARGIMTKGHPPICETASDAFNSILALLDGLAPTDRVFVAPVSFRQAEPDVYRRARELADETGIRLYTHVAETAAEVATVRAEHGCGPIEHLHQLGFTGPDTILVHCVLLSDEEIELLASTGTHVVHCPSNHMKLAKGFTRVPDLLEAGVNVGLGVDQMVDLFREMRQEVLLQSIRAGDPGILSPRTAINMATQNGGTALASDDALGTLDPGAVADVICVDVTGPNYQPILDPAWSLVHRGQGSDVSHVVVDGEVVVRDRRLTKIDGDALQEEALDRIDSYLARSGISETRLGQMSSKAHQV